MQNISEFTFGLQHRELSISSITFGLCISPKITIKSHQSQKAQITQNSHHNDNIQKVNQTQPMTPQPVKLQHEFEVVQAPTQAYSAKLKTMQKKKSQKQQKIQKSYEYKLTTKAKNSVLELLKRKNQQQKKNYQQQQQQRQ